MERRERNTFGLKMYHRVKGWCFSGRVVKKVQCDKTPEKPEKTSLAFCKCFYIFLISFL